MDDLNQIGFLISTVANAFKTTLKLGAFAIVERAKND